MADPFSKRLGEARLLAEAGRGDDACAAYADAYRLAASTGDDGSSSLFGNAAQRHALAALGYAEVALEAGTWPTLQGFALDELLLEALKKLRAPAPSNGSASRRELALEGHLLLKRSQALFAKPARGDKCLDAAIESRLESAELLRAAAVSSLPWPLARAKELMTRCAESADGNAQLDEATLLARLRSELGDLPGAEENVGHLFGAWSAAGEDGRQALSLRAFLEQFIAIAEELEGGQCGAPCEGGGLPEGASELERELVALVAKSGAGSWEAKASQLCSQGLATDAASLERMWRELAPTLRKVVEQDAPMSCGHSCSSCPTRQDCQVHTALKDLEDLC
eukprot:TRINITY_DN26568_c0_g1_i1.p1 TRINITY_DN26568_c0_g1~~TRINITY_DN26568_c0_g1_i1.p1  ORF type:complete len:339 (-),score=92.33 TRINITY_DN26568_c0_g1_i1:116-1132(-)